MTKIIKIGDREINIRDNLTGLDWLNSLPKKQQMGMNNQVRLIAMATQEPTKMSQKEVSMLPYGEFMQLMAAFNKAYGLTGDYDFLEQK